MSQDMPASWRYLTSATNKLSSFKGYFNQAGLAAPLSQAANAVGGTDEPRQSWRNWAAEKIHGKYGSQGQSGDEIITLFPGWAVRRYLNNAHYRADELVPFELEALVSGYAITSRSKAQASRSQRAFLRLAQRFAALPRITLDGSISTTPPAEGILNPSQGMKIPDDQQVQLLDQQLQQAKIDDSDSDALSDREGSSSQNSLRSTSPTGFSTTPPKVVDTPEALIRKLHHNLETRLRPFWSSTLPARTVRLHLFASPHQPLSQTDMPAKEGDYKPLATKDVTTAVDGSFSARFRVNWNDLCHNPQASFIAFGEPVQEHDLLVIAELLPLPPDTPTPRPATSSSNTHRQRPSQSHDLQSSHPRLSHLLTSLPTSLSNYLHHNLSALLSPTSTALAQIHIPITQCSLRVISDIDDTVKLSGVPDGARAVFHNVFVKELKDGVIPGMGEWYSEMWKKGVRFHYVSNGPFEYLSVLYEFFEISKLPPGSIKLKSYAGRSLLSGLLSTPAERKRAGVIEILDSFPQSRFILIGDSGEQDLELYADIARERPAQILAVFIRDAGEGTYDPIVDPTGWNVLGANQSNARLQSLQDDYGEESLFREAIMRNTANKGGSVASSSRRPPSDATLDEPNLSGKMFTDKPLSEEPQDDSITNDRPAISIGQEDVETPKARIYPTTKSGNRSPPPPSLSYPSTYAARASPRSSPTISVFTPSITSKSAVPNLKDQFITRPPSPTPPPTVSGALPRPPPPPRSGTGAAAQAYAQLQAQYANLQQSKPSNASSSSSSSPSPNYKNFGGRAERNAARYGSMTAVPRSVSGTASTSSSGSWSGGGKLTEPEKRRVELQARVYRARTQMPGGVPLRIFRHPEECVEAQEILGHISKDTDTTGIRS